MRGDELGRVLRPGEVADLRAGVHALHRLAGQRVPEANASIGRASAGREETVMMR